jgi:hypothetical protein
MMTSAWPHADVIVDPVNGRRSQGGHWSVSGSHRQVGPACQCHGKKRKRKRALLGRMSSWASLPPWPSGPNSARPLLLLLFLFLLSPLQLTTPAHLSATPGSRAASSRSGANSSVCVRVCVSCVCWAGSPRRECDVAAWVRRRSKATTARPGVLAGKGPSLGVGPHTRALARAKGAAFGQRAGTLAGKALARPWRAGGGAVLHYEATAARCRR